jgi:hypothetical protein
MNTSERNSRAHPGKKPAKVDRFIAELTIQPSIELAAKNCGIAVSTGYRWLRDPLIAERRRQAAQENSRQAMLRLREIMCRCVNRLGKLADNAESESVQVAACKAALDFSLKSAEIEDLQRQIDELRQILKSGNRSLSNGSNQHQSDTAPARTAGEIN